MQGEWVKPDSSGNADFYAETEKGVLRTVQDSADSASQRSVAPPKDEIETHREIAYTDPHVHEGLETLIDWIVGDGFNIQPRRFITPMETPGQAESREDPAQQQVPKLRRLMQNSPFWRVFNDWVRYGIIDGHSFMQIVVEDGIFKPKLLPTERMHRDLDEKHNIEGYILEPPDGGPDDDEATEFAPHEIAELYFRKEAIDEFGRSFVEPVKEQADMLRDMEIDYARFVATKAYPPILWKLGDDEHNWTQDQVEAWMDNVQSIEPDSMLAAPHDVDTEIVGTTSTSSTAGAMRLEDTFLHFQNRIVTGLGVPALLMNMDPGASGQASATAMMPAYKRRITRLQNIVKSAVEDQILKSLIVESAGYEEFDGVVPEFEFGEYSSAEKRLEVDKILRLLNNGMLRPEAAAERLGIDMEELPDIWDGADLMTVLNALSGTGDNIQNPQGGSPTDTGGGTESAGGEVTSRQDPTADSTSGRNRQSVTEDEDA